MSLPGLPPDALATGSAAVFLGYAGLALSSIFAILAVLRVVRGRKPVRGSGAAIPVSVVLAIVSYAWLSDTWRSWRHEQCLGGKSSYCNTAADARPPLWPF